MKIDKTDQPLTRLTETRKTTSITKIRNERGVISADLAHIKKIAREYYKQYYAHKLSDSDEIDQFLKNSKRPKLTRDETENPNNPITIKGLKSVVKNVLKKKSLGSNVNSTK